MRKKENVSSLRVKLKNPVHIVFGKGHGILLSAQYTGDGRECSGYD